MGFKPIEVTSAGRKNGAFVAPCGQNSLVIKFCGDALKGTGLTADTPIQPFWDSENRWLLLTSPDSREQALDPSVRTLRRATKASPTLQVSWPWKNGLSFFPKVTKTRELLIQEKGHGRIVLRIPKTFDLTTTP